ncbi:hypothetical protein BJ508DRAFT_103465 [Ascobolus immersus RN42]|uniref:Uncharacterized protein n=1 Tax=Ascobolus immersus RN42 TaxID=1160509 RepID=A0A3N4HE10_ASCIM|nr:hypothetical protein BJ508DRAFT_103465 [Ascobolus immersus RN42]
MLLRFEDTRSSCSVSTPPTRLKRRISGYTSPCAFRFCSRPGCHQLSLFQEKKKPPANLPTTSNPFAPPANQFLRKQTILLRNFDLKSTPLPSPPPPVRHFTRYIVTIKTLRPAGRLLLHPKSAIQHSLGQYDHTIGWSRLHGATRGRVEANVLTGESTVFGRSGDGIRLGLAFSIAGLEAVWLLRGCFAPPVFR